MPQIRRPSILNTPRYSEDDGEKLQKAIQTLRLRTQESLAESREEIARLEEENEIKQMRIEEIDAEIQELESEGEFGQVANLKEFTTTSTRSRGKRRWSLAALGIKHKNGGHHTGVGDDSHKNTRRPRSKSNDEGDFDAEDDDGGEKRGGKRFSLMGRKSGSFRISKGKNMSQTEKEALLMHRLHDIQEENKKLIEQQETELEFKEQQVKALELAFEEQTKIIDDLEQEIALVRDESENTDSENESMAENEEDSAKFLDRLVALNDKENEISSRIRLIRKVQGMDEEERNAALSQLKREMVESLMRLKSVKSMYAVNSEVLKESIVNSEDAWTLLGIKLALMERVSQKQIGRLQKKISSGEHEDLVDLIERAQQALEEELTMREDADTPENGSVILQEETDNIKELVQVLLQCCKSFVDGLLLLKTKELSLHAGDTIVTILRQMEKTIEATENTISSALYVIDDAIEKYSKDTSLLPDDIQAALEEGEEKAESDDGSIGSNSDDVDDMTDVVHPELEDLQDRNDELDERIRELNHKLEDERLQSTVEIEFLSSKLTDLVQQYNLEGLKWDHKDEEIEKAMQNAETAKVAEDRVRDFLERVARSRIQLPQGVGMKVE